MTDNEKFYSEALTKLLKTLEDAKGVTPENQPSVIIDLDTLPPATDLDGNEI